MERQAFSKATTWSIWTAVLDCAPRTKAIVRPVYGSSSVPDRTTQPPATVKRTSCKSRARISSRISHPFPSSSLKFQPTDSAVYQSNLASGAQAIDWSLLEIALLVRRANPKGTLRVSAPGVKSDGFSAIDRALLTEAATLTAPATAQTSDGSASYPLTGWVLEIFDETTGLWTETATGTGTSYAWTPDPDVRARLTWLYDRDTPAYRVTGDSERTSDGGLVGTFIKENVTVEPAADGGYYAAGTEVTVTATPDTTDFSAGEAKDSRSYQSQFVRWIGDTDGLDRIARHEHVLQALNGVRQRERTDDDDDQHDKQRGHTNLVELFNALGHAALDDHHTDEQKQRREHRAAERIVQHCAKRRPAGQRRTEDVRIDEIVLVGIRPPDGQRIRTQRHRVGEIGIGIAASISPPPTNLLTSVWHCSPSA